MTALWAFLVGYLGVLAAWIILYLFYFVRILIYKATKGGIRNSVSAENSNGEVVAEATGFPYKRRAVSPEPSVLTEVV